MACYLIIFDWCRHLDLDTYFSIPSELTDLTWIVSFHFFTNYLSPWPRFCQETDWTSFCLPGLLRCGKSCRLRWTNYLRPDIKRGEFTATEEQTIIQLHALLGNRWTYDLKHYYVVGGYKNTLNPWSEALTKRSFGLLDALPFLLLLQVVFHCCTLAQEDWQWDKELLEHSPQEEADQDGSWSNNS